MFRSFNEMCVGVQIIIPLFLILVLLVNYFLDIMAVASARGYILNRRRAAISDLGSARISDGESDAHANVDYFKVNSRVVIGIGTATEVGLDQSRYPYIVRLLSATLALHTEGQPIDWSRVASATADTSTVSMVRYFRLLNAAMGAVAHTVTPTAAASRAHKLLRLCPALEDWAFTRHEAAVASGRRQVHPPVADAVARSQVLANLLNIPNPTAEQSATLLNAAQGFMEAHSNIGLEFIPVFFLEPSVALEFKPYGHIGPTIAEGGEDHEIPHAQAASYEFMLTMTVNAARMAARYNPEEDRPAVPHGMIKNAAMTIAAAQQQGLLEVSTRREFNIIGVTMGEEGNFTIRHVDMAGEGDVPEDLQVGQEIDISGSRVSNTELELANIMVFNAGLMHYLLNHSTGGELLSGPALTTLAMYNIYDKTVDVRSRSAVVQTGMDPRVQTSVVYEALHPICKRGIANLFFRNSGVETWERLAAGRAMRKYELDAFASIRADPRPAGSHKAYLFLLALDRVLESGIGPFLPWAQRITEGVASARAILEGGARAHIGSAYYTGRPPRVQSSDLDSYMPELAAYIHTMSPGNTLALSPHLSMEVASRAAESWKALLNQTKGVDLSTMDLQTIARYLKVAGRAKFDFDPDNEASWGTTIEQTTNAVGIVRAALSFH